MKYWAPSVRMCGRSCLVWYVYLMVLVPIFLTHFFPSEWHKVYEIVGDAIFVTCEICNIGA